MVRQHDVFLSYARADPEDRIVAVESVLGAAGHAVWRDRAEMPSRGLSFLEEIRRAIREARRVVVALGPAAAGSEHVRMEWQYALAVGRVVVPVLLTADHSLLPPELRSLHTCVVEDAQGLAELVRIVGEPDQPLGRLYGVPQAPPHFRPRARLISELTAFVLEDHEVPVVLEGAGQRTVVYGMGGSGKSVLAAAFARSVAVRRTFGDGIYWFNQRQGVDAQALVDGLKARLAGSLADRACLVVLDNVDTVRFLEPFAAELGPDSRLVVTTRDRRIQQALSARKVLVDDLSDGEALEHLSDWTGTPPADLPAAARAVVRATGGNMLALTLAGAFLGASHGAYEDLLAGLSQSQPELMDRELIAYEYDGVMRSIDASVSRLTEHAGALLRDLIAVPPGATMPTSLVHRLAESTGIPRHRAVAALVELGAMRLVREEHDGISLHDLQHLYLRATCADPAAVHARLLTICGLPSLWDRLPTEPYWYRFLSHHLLEAGEQAELVGLLTSSPSWLRASLATLRDVGPFREDVERALQSELMPTERVRLHAVRRTAREEALRYSADQLRCLIRRGEPELARSCARLSGFDHLVAVLTEEKGRDEAFVTEVVEWTRLLGPVRRAFGQAALLAISETVVALTLADFETNIDVMEAPNVRDQLCVTGAVNLMKLGLFDDARRISQHIDSEADLETCMIQQAVQLARLGRLDEARTTITTLPDDAVAPAQLALLEAEKRLGAPSVPPERRQLLGLASRRGASATTLACVIVAAHLWPDAGRMLAARQMRLVTKSLDRLGKADSRDRFEALQLVVTGLVRVETHQSLSTAGMVLRAWQQWLFADEHYAGLYPERRILARAAAELAAALVRQDRVQEAQELVAYDRSDLHGLPVYDAVAVEAARCGRRDATSLFERAVARGEAVAHLQTRPRVVGALALRLPERRDSLLDLALALALDDPQARFDLADLLARAERFDDALAVATSIEHSRLGTAATGNVVLKLIGAGGSEQARRQLKALVKRSPAWDMGAQIQLIHLGDALAGVGWLAEATRIGRTTSGSEMVRRRIRAHLATTDYATAITEARATSEDERPGWLSLIASECATTDLELAGTLFDEALGIVPDDEGRLAIVVDLAGAGLVPRAAQTAGSIRVPAVRSKAWSSVAKIAGDAGVAPPADWHRNAEAALEAATGTDRDDALRYLANATVTLGFDPVPVLARITDPGFRRAASGDVADIQAYRGDLPTALRHNPEEGLDLWLEWLLEYSVEAFREAVTIACWSSPQWQVVCSTAWPDGNADPT